MVYTDIATTIDTVRIAAQSLNAMQGNFIHMASNLLQSEHVQTLLQNPSIQNLAHNTVELISNSPIGHAVETIKTAVENAPTVQEIGQTIMHKVNEVINSGVDLSSQKLDGEPPGESIGDKIVNVMCGTEIAAVLLGGSYLGFKLKQAMNKISKQRVADTLAQENYDKAEKKAKQIAKANEKEQHHKEDLISGRAIIPYLDEMYGKDESIARALLTNPNLGYKEIIDYGNALFGQNWDLQADEEVRKRQIRVIKQMVATKGIEPSPNGFMAGIANLLLARVQDNRLVTGPGGIQSKADRIMDDLATAVKANAQLSADLLDEQLKFKGISRELAEMKTLREQALAALNGGAHNSGKLLKQLVARNTEIEAQIAERKRRLDIKI